MMDDRGKTGTKKHIMSRINLVHVANVSIRQRGEWKKANVNVIKLMQLMFSYFNSAWFNTYLNS